MTKITTQPHKACEQRFPSCQSWAFIMHTESTVKPRVTVSTISSISLTRKVNVKRKKKQATIFKWTLCFLINSLCFITTSWRCLNALQWFPTALKMTLKFPEIVFELLSLFCRLSLFIPSYAFSLLLTLLGHMTLWQFPKHRKSCLWLLLLFVILEQFPCVVFLHAFFSNLRSNLNTKLLEEAFTNYSIQRRSMPCNPLTLNLVVSFRSKFILIVLNYLLSCACLSSPSAPSLKSIFHKRRDQKLLINILKYGRHSARP